MVSPVFIIENVNPADFPAVQAFYATVGYTYPISPDSRVLVARSGSRILGAVRLSMEERIQVLRGMMIAPDYERQGIGTFMLREVEKYMGTRDCFCLPHKWLEGFYGQIGFVRVPDESLAPFLQKRLAEQRAGEYPNLIAMRRPAVITTISVKASEIGRT